MTGQLQGKTALITGASAGIGEALAHTFSREGANVVLIARRRPQLEALKHTLENTYGIKAFIIALDVSDPSSVEKGLSPLPAPDILINNAGLVRGLHRVWESSVEDCDEMIDTNIKGILNVTRILLPKMIEQQRGDIVNIDSIAGHESYPGGGIYCATKFAVRAITDSLRKELVDTPLRVAMISPGMVNTEFSTVRFRGDKKRADAVYAGIDPLSAQDVADAILFIVTRRPNVNVADLILFPTHQASVSIVHRKS